MKPTTLIKKRNEAVLFYDIKTQLNYKITKLFSEHEVNHITVIYLSAVNGKHKQQFSDYYFRQLIEDKQIIEL